MTSNAALPMQRPVSHALAAFALALLLGLQPITTDLYLPALPLLRRALGADMASAQLTMSALILAFGVGQLFWGPVADRTGRRPVLLWGLALYTLASAACALAASIELLIIARALQGACMAAAVVVARAILRDLYEPEEGARVMALALSGLAVIALCGPVLGGVITAWAGWRATLTAVTLLGGAILAFVSWRLPETVRQRNPRATTLAPLFGAWRQMARHPTFRAWTLLVSCSYGGLFTMLAGSSFVYMDMLGLSPAAYGAAIGTMSLSYGAATLVCRRWIRTLGMAGAVWRGAFFTLAAGLLIVGCTAAGLQSIWVVLVTQWLLAFGHGMHQPCGQAGSVSAFPHAAGTASALAGFMLAFTAFCIGRFLGLTLSAGLWPFAACLGFWALATSTVAWTLVQRLPK
jgi:DHA1 family bicyclomycin/chloramphenicol resistance-like MFS transporter